MNKARPNKLQPFAAKLKEWAAAGKTLSEMQSALFELGCTVGLSSLSEFCARQRQEALEAEMFAQIASGGRMNRELDRAFQQNPAPEIDRLIQVTKTLVMSLQVKGVADPKLLGLANSMQQTVLGYLSDKSKVELKREELNLAQSKYRDQVAERKRAIESELAKGKSSGGITPETLEKIEAELKLL